MPSKEKEGADNAELEVEETAAALEQESEPPETSYQWTGIAAGDHFTCGLQTDGSLWCWGENSHGQLGQGDLEPTEDPVQVGEAEDWISLSAGSQHICGIRQEGTLWCWGKNATGALGDGSTSDRTHPVQVPGEGWTAVDAGRTHTCALDPEGGAFCWGANLRGQLGDRTTEDSSAPVRVFTSRQFQIIAAATYYTCGIDTTGVLWCWGGSETDHPISERSFPGKSGDNLARWTALSAGDFHTCGIRGTTAGDPEPLFCWGHDAGGRFGPGSEPFQPEGLRIDDEHWQHVSARAGHTCGIRANGSALCWGQTSPEELQDSSATRLDIAVGAQHTCAIDDEQNLHCWKQEDSAEAVEATEQDNVSEFFILTERDILHWYRIGFDAGEVITLDSTDLRDLSGIITNRTLVNDLGIAILTKEPWQLPSQHGPDPHPDELAKITYRCGAGVRTCASTVRRIYIAPFGEDRFEAPRQIDISSLPDLPEQEDFPLGVLEEGNPIDEILFRPADDGQLWLSQCLATHYEDACGYGRPLPILPTINGEFEFAKLPYFPIHEDESQAPEGIDLVLDDRGKESFEASPILFCLSSGGRTQVVDENYPSIMYTRWLGQDPPLYVRQDFHTGYIGPTEYPVFQACEEEPLYQGEVQDGGGDETEQQPQGFLTFSPEIWAALDESGWHIY